MKKRLTALLLAGLTALSLAGCGPKDSAPTEAPTPDVPEEAVTSVIPTPDEGVAEPVETEVPGGNVSSEVEALPEVEHETLPAATPAPSQAASEVPAPDQTVRPTATTTPAATPVVTTSAPTPTQAVQATAAPTATPTPTPKPTDAPTPKPTATPTPTPAAKEPSVAEVYAAVARAAGASYDDMTAVADAFYTTLSDSDVEEMAFYMPSMSAQLEEIFVARAKSGKAGAVKAACAARQSDLAEEAAFYGENGRFVESYQLVTEGDWVLFCVGEKAAAAAGAFRSAVK